MTAPTWDTLRGAIEKMVAYPAGDGWHVSREAADKALEWIGWAETHQPSPVPKLLSEEDEDLSLVWRTVDGWAIHRTFPSDGEPYWLAMPARTPEALANSPEVQALIAAAETRGWNAATNTLSEMWEGEKARAEAAEADITTYQQIVADMTQEAEAAEAELAALRAQVERMTGALTGIADFAEKPGHEFAKLHPKLNAALDAVPQDRWAEVLSEFTLAALTEGAAP